MDAGRDSRSLG